MKTNVILVFLVLGMISHLSAKPSLNPMELATKMSIVDEFLKIKSSELTPPVIEEILKQYPTSKLGAAYKNEKGEFKLIMVLQSGTRRTVYIDQYGNWMKKQ